METGEKKWKGMETISGGSKILDFSLSQRKSTKLHLSSTVKFYKVAKNELYM